MAITGQKQHLRIGIPNDAWLSFAARYLPEGASQTFVSEAPLVWSSGLVVEATTPVNTTNKPIGFALTAGQNGTGKFTKMLPAYHGLMVFATFLAAAAADQVLAATDMGLLYLLQKTANFPTTAANGWYLEKTVTNAVMRVTSFGAPNPTDQYPNNTTQVAFVAGDTNPRLGCELVAAGNAWF